MRPASVLGLVASASAAAVTVNTTATATSAAASSTVSASAGDSNTTATMWAMSTDSEFDFHLQMLLSLASGGGSSSGEILRAASQITPGDFESFYTEMNFLAKSIHNMGSAAEAAGFSVSARDAYFRSASYFRAADFFLHHNKSDPRLTTLWDAQLEDFGKAISLLSPPGERIWVPGPGYDIPLYFFPAKRAHGSYDSALPTVLIGTGYDGAQEELYHGYCTHVVERGMNCITYEGPGQPTVVRRSGVGFTPEWWTVVTPIMDYLLQYRTADVDGTRIALAGESFGGQLVPLALTHESRFAAVMLIDGIVSVYTTIASQYPSILLDPLEAGNATEFDTIVEEIYNAGLGGTAFKWSVDQGLFSFATDSPYVWLSELHKFDINATVLSQINVPVFVGAGQIDEQAPGQAPQVWHMLGKGQPSFYYEFKAALGGGLHCQIGAEAQLADVSLGWLADIFNM
ncbi:MAG: hypothetical protein STHCBS139747_006088 [Sporothrix thermara]